MDPLFARLELLAMLGREPTLTEVAKRVGCSVWTVSKDYRLAGLSTRAGVAARTRQRDAAVDEMVSSARSALMASLGRAPLVSEIAGALSLRHSVARLSIKRLGLDTKAGQRALMEMSHRWRPGWWVREGIEPCVGPRVHGDCAVAAMEFLGE